MRLGKHSDYTIVVPAKGETTRLANFLRDCPDANVIIVVPRTEFEAAKRTYRRAVVLSESDFGYGAAIKTGISHSKDDVVAVLDGDGTYDTSDVCRAVANLETEGLDAVFSERFSKQENTMQDTRKFGNQAINLFLSILLPYNVNDSQSGLYAIRKSSFKGAIPKENGFAFCQELKFAAVKRNMKVKWIPISYHDRSAGSKFNFFLDGVKLVASAIREKINGAVDNEK